ncbi:MAG: hypothetical protein JSV91_02805 [Phycisphaerales bacterium]|nr:MAG: hypothetical protein JSV91_02805 [Phycisphaerales bacterium]
MLWKLGRTALLMIPIYLTGCSTIPPEAILVTRQVEANLEIIEANNLAVLDEWHALSVDYWTEKVARDGADIILQKAREQGIEIDLNEDYRDLTAQVLREYRMQFLDPLNQAYAEYRQQIWADYALTKDAVQHIGDLLEANVRLQQQQKALIDDAVPNVSNMTPRIMQFMEGLDIMWKSMAGDATNPTSSTDAG